jgi:hypothetical protein
MLFLLNITYGNSDVYKHISNENIKKLDEITYKEEVKRLFTDITKIHNRIASINSSDIENYKSALDEITTLYEELKDLKAPSSLKAVHKKLKKGISGTLEILYINILLFKYNPQKLPL